MARNIYKKPGISINYDIHTYFYLGKDKNDFTFVYAKAGWGKTLLIECIMEEYKRRGYTIVVLSDVKDSFEFMYAMFEPRSKVHLEHLRLIGKQPKKYDVKIYHPFTFDIPRNRKLPEINFYGFALKELRRSEWSMLAESAFESETIRLLLNATNSLGDTEGLYSFLHRVQDSVTGKREKQRLKADPNVFHLNINTASAKGLQEVASYLLPYKNDYFLVPNNSPIKIDFKNIINDNKHYHLFTTHFIKDDKTKEFCILALFNQLIRSAKTSAKRPILVVIPEIRFLVPIRPEGYKKFLAFGIKSNLSIMRNIGRGISGLFDSQVWGDVDDGVKNSATVSFYGELGGEQDIDRVVKANRFDKEVSEKLRKMVDEESDPYHCYLKKGNEKDPGVFRGFFPSHCHNEDRYNFFEMYQQEYGEKMKTYNELLDSMKKQLKEEDQKFRDKVKNREKQEKEEAKRKKKERDMKQKAQKEIEQKVEKVKQLESKGKEALMKLCYEMVNDENIDKKDRTFRKIGEKLNLNHITVKKYSDKYKESLFPKNHEEQMD